MSDLNDLIHRNAQLAFEQGRNTERERIIKLLEKDGYMIESDKNHAIALIKGEQK